LIDRTRVKAALDWIDKNVAPLGVDFGSVIDAVGRVLAEPVDATADIPRFDRAAIDGIAVRAEETVGASAYNPLSFRLVPQGEALPKLGAARVDAGEPLPTGADTVVPLEYASLDAAGGYEIIEPVEAGGHVEHAGSHAARDAILLPAGRELRPYDIGLLALAGVSHVPVIRRPTVRIVVTGRGLSQSDAPSSSAAVYDTDGPLLRALVQRDGGILADLCHIDRDRRKLHDALTAPGLDILLVAGATGNGTDDFAGAVLAEVGELAIHGVALSPGESAGMGRAGAGALVFLLPGAPAACLWAYELFAGRAIRRLGGRNPALPFRSTEMLTNRKIVSRIGVTEICPVRCRDNRSVEPIASFAEAGLMSASRADGFVIIPDGSEGFPEGAAVTVYLQQGFDAPSSLISEGPDPKS
jgi:molybdopterin molybdotransferase